MKEALCLSVEVPFCAFRPYTSREYQDTYPVPTPSAVYGMLLSFVGVPREEKAAHCGAQMALAVPSLPERSRVFRKLRRGDDLENLRPDYQDLLVDLRLWVWLQQGRDGAAPTLVDRVAATLANPSATSRSGGLSLGESSYLVNELRIESTLPETAIFFKPDAAGFHSLPIWVDHADAKKTRLQRFSLEPLATRQALSSCWFYIEA